jgi:secondary thiamine-phosphate synthase enzyme
MTWQKEITLPAFPRGFHIITSFIERELNGLPNEGLLNIFIKHTSAGITINENADPTVLSDFESAFNNLIPDGHPEFIHTSEGPDDMPAHIKSTLTGHSLNIPIRAGRLNLGTWQGIYLCEFRNRGGGRKLVLTVIS